MPVAQLPAGVTVRLSADEEAYLRKFYDDAGGRGWSYDHFKRNHSQLLGGVTEGWSAKKLKPEYGTPDHLVRANFEADVHRFGYNKTVAQVLELNRILKASANYDGFREEAGKLLTAYNERNLRAEYNMAKATATATANVMRAVADGAKFMRHKATQDARTRPVHAALHNKVWRIDDPTDTDWRRWVVPLGWACRCNDIFEDEADAADIITNDEAEQLTGTDEVTRLKRDGFLIDRVDKKKLFTDRQNYLNDLSDPDAVNFQVAKLSYADQGQEPWATFDKSGLPALNLQRRTKADAISDFEAAATDGRKPFTDYAGRPLFLDRQSLDDHLQDKYTTQRQNRQSYYFRIEEVLREPDEVYFFDKNDLRSKTSTDPKDALKLSYTYLKFYQDDVVLVAVEFDVEQPQVVKTWYRVDQPDTRRKGLLIHQRK